MRQAIANILWIGDGGDLLKPALLEFAGIKAVVQVALEEKMPQLSRELLVCHFPIVDGPGNPPAILAAALETTASLIRNGVPTLICCSAGMSRSPCIAAGAISLARGLDPHVTLKELIQTGPHDVSPGLWEAVCGVLRARSAR